MNADAKSVAEHIVIGDNPVLHILLADDSEGDIMLMTESFKDSAVPCHFYIVRDGDEVLTFLDENDHHLDLIIMDINMPRLNGRDTLAKIRESETHQSTPVVMFTSSELDADIEYVRDAHANGYVLKQGIYDLQAFINVMELAKQNPKEFYQVGAH